MSSSPDDKSSSAPAKKGAMPRAGRRAVITNAVVKWVGFLAAVVVSFYMSPIMVRSLGESKFGVWSLVESFVAYFGLFDLGVTVAIQRFIPKFAVRRDHQELNRIFTGSLLVFGITGLVLTGVVTGLFFFWERPFGVAPDLAMDTRWLILLLGSSLALALFLGVYKAVLEGMGNYTVTTGMEMVVLLVRSALFLPILRGGASLPSLAAINLLCTVLHTLVLMAWVRYSVPDLRFSYSAVRAGGIRDIIGYGSNAFVTMIAGRIAQRSDAMVIGIALGTQPLAFFVLANRLVEYVKSAIGSATIVLTPAISALEEQGDLHRVRLAVIDGTRYVLYLVTPIQMAIVQYGWLFFYLWMGERYADLCNPLLLIMILPIALTLSQAVAHRVLNGMGHIRIVMQLAMAHAVVNLPLSIVLVKFMGVEGVALASALTLFLQSVGLSIAVCRATELNYWTFLRRSFLLPTLMIPLTLVMWPVMQSLHLPKTWLTFLIVVAASVIPYMMAVAIAEYRSYAGLLARIRGRFVKRPTAEPIREV